MRRGVGVSAVKQRAKANKAYEAVGQAAAAENLAHVEALMTTFKASLEDFARKHKKDINQDPAFRQQFQTMCTNIGVDPLASKKGFWSEVLGVGDFYYELSVQITEVCLATRPTNGGLLALQELLDRLRAKRSAKSNAISADDVKRAIALLHCDVLHAIILTLALTITITAAAAAAATTITTAAAKLKVLGSGFGLVDVGRTTMVVSVPRELSGDAAAVLQLMLAAVTAYYGVMHNFSITAVLDSLAESGGYTSVSAAQAALQWTPDRAKRALTSLAQDGMAWIDSAATTANSSSSTTAEDSYYFPSLWRGDHYLGVDAEADAKDEQKQQQLQQQQQKG
eukprot:3194-Heterococcus_DN1.PRE.4